ncbi:MAG: hypothetical protein ACOCWG_06255, partial [bacterium]
EPIVSEAEMENMMNEGTWEGGFVENMGYVTQQTAAFSGDGFHTSGTELMNNIKSESGFNGFVSGLLDATPGIGAIKNHAQTELNNMRNDFAKELWNKGYSPNAGAYIGKEKSGNSFVYTLYDYGGNKITSGEMGLGPSEGWESD